MRIPKTVMGCGVGGGSNLASPEEAEKASAVQQAIPLLMDRREQIFYVARLIRDSWNSPFAVFPGHKVGAKLANGEIVHDWREKGF